LFDGTGSCASWDDVECIAGRRKGSEPEGDAWLVEDIRRWSIPAILRKVCPYVREI